MFFLNGQTLVIIETVSILNWRIQSRWRIESCTMPGTLQDPGLHDRGAMFKTKRLLTDLFTVSAVGCSPLGN